MDLMVSTFYTVMGYVCLDIIFAITLHYIAKNNDAQVVAGLGLAFTTVNVLMIPMALGCGYDDIFNRNKSIFESTFSLGSGC